MKPLTHKVTLVNKGYVTTTFYVRAETSDDAYTFIVDSTHRIFDYAIVESLDDLQVKFLLNFVYGPM